MSHSPYHYIKDPGASPSNDSDLTPKFEHLYSFLYLPILCFSSKVQENNHGPYHLLGSSQAEFLEPYLLKKNKAFMNLLSKEFNVH